MLDRTSSSPLHIARALMAFRDGRRDAAATVGALVIARLVLDLGAMARSVVGLVNGLRRRG